MTKSLMELENEVEIVKQLTGIFDEKRIAVSETGWTSRTYIVHDGDGRTCILPWGFGLQQYFGGRRQSGGRYRFRRCRTI